MALSGFSWFLLVFSGRPSRKQENSCKDRAANCPLEEQQVFPGSPAAAQQPAAVGTGVTHLDSQQPTGARGWQQGIPSQGWSSDGATLSVGWGAEATPGPVGAEAWPNASGSRDALQTPGRRLGEA